MSDISSIKLPDNSSYNVKAKKIFYAECSTARNVAAKVVTCSDFVLETGAVIAIRFTNMGTTNPASGNITLNINGTGAKNIVPKDNNSVYNYSAGAVFCKNQTLVFVYNGTYFVHINRDVNTDTKVTSVGNHYLPVRSVMIPAYEGVLTDITNSSSGTQVVTGVEMDDRGHVTGVTSVALKSTDTKVTVDSALSSTSTNPVQNKAVYTALAGKAASSHNHSDYALKSLYGDNTINVGRKAGTTVGTCSTAEGVNTTASGTNGSHAEGANTTASGGSAHAEGYGTTASGECGSHAEGWNTVATGTASSAHGFYTQALHDYEASFGKCNVSNNDTLFSIGDGTSDDARHNAFEITTAGGKLHDKDIATTDLADASNRGLMSSEHYNFIEKYKKIRGSSASYTFTALSSYITVNECYGNCNNGLVILSGWFTSTGSAGNPTIISGSFPSAESSFVCGIIVNIDSPNTNTRLLVRHESNGSSSLQCGGNLTPGKYFFLGVYTVERCTYNLPY